MHLFYLPSAAPGMQQLDATESQHCIRVLRLGKGAEIHVTDGQGHKFRAVMRTADTRGCVVETMEEIPVDDLRDWKLHLAVAPTKNSSRFEWFLEKATEMGVDEITPLVCMHSERVRLNLDRQQKILISSMKQSLGTRLPLIHPLVPLEDFLDREQRGQRLMGWMRPGITRWVGSVFARETHTTFLIGPEGDFSEEEAVLAMEKGYLPISLGPNRLRTETAALAACFAAHLLNGS
ncbi:MAG: 16S rRNA (uracil(1498)-N(3))-methyltransferase [Bacteroidales bacterium]|nr:16S rRNA (uracil(1498)-N(3))-methyltransferase [Bacteroidales bacterium]